MVNGNRNVVQSVNHFHYYHPSDGVVRGSGKVFFTANQWQDFERQTMIYKYLMAAIPVPPQLLVSLSTQSNRVSMLRFSNGSDPEPWRCRRTDGKKWRCAKDVAPEQKYCERHVRKTRSRSRKPVEATHIKDNPTVLSAANQQPECNDWLMKNAGIPVYQSKNQFQQEMQSAIGGSKRDQISKQDFKGNHQQNSFLDRNVSHPNTSFTGVDAWSRIGGGDECSLTLSMQSGGNQMAFDHESFQMAVEMLSGERDGCEDVLKPHHHWLNQTCWAGLGSSSGSGSVSDSTPGGPLGEALCLGITSTRDEPFSHGYSYNTTTGSSREGGGLNFVG